MGPIVGNEVVYYDIGRKKVEVSKFFNGIVHLRPLFHVGKMLYLSYNPSRLGAPERDPRFTRKMPHLKTDIKIWEHFVRHSCLSFIYEFQVRIDRKPSQLFHCDSERTRRTCAQWADDKSHIFYVHLLKFNGFQLSQTRHTMLTSRFVNFYIDYMRSFDYRVYSSVPVALLPARVPTQAHVIYMSDNIVHQPIKSLGPLAVELIANEYMRGYFQKIISSNSGINAASKLAFYYLWETIGFKPPWAEQPVVFEFVRESCPDIVELVERAIDSRLRSNQPEYTVFTKRYVEKIDNFDANSFTQTALEIFVSVHTRAVAATNWHGPIQESPPGLIKYTMTRTTTLSTGETNSIGYRDVVFYMKSYADMVTKGSFFLVRDLATNEDVTIPTTCDVENFTASTNCFIKPMHIAETIYFARLLRSESTTKTPKTDCLIDSREPWTHHQLFTLFACFEKVIVIGNANNLFYKISDFIHNYCERKDCSLPIDKKMRLV